jgi:hypothetical protein
VAMAIYFPHFQVPDFPYGPVPDTSWLTQVFLYWDGVHLLASRHQHNPDAELVRQQRLSVRRAPGTNDNAELTIAATARDIQAST